MTFTDITLPQIKNICMIFFKRKFLHSLPSHHSFIHKWVHIYIYSLCVNIHTVWKSIWNVTLIKTDDINKHSFHIVELWSCSSFAVYMWKDEAHVPTLLLKGALSFRVLGLCLLGLFQKSDVSTFRPAYPCVLCCTHHAPVPWCLSPCLLFSADPSCAF